MGVIIMINYNDTFLIELSFKAWKLLIVATLLPLLDYREVLYIVLARSLQLSGCHGALRFISGFKSHIHCFSASF